MDQKKIDRINVLARKSRTTALTAEERAEQKALREEYMEAMRHSLMEEIENTYICQPDGTKRPLTRKTGLPN